MIILSVDTSTMAASAAVTDGKKLCGEFFTDFKLKHSEKLMFLIDDLLRRLHMSISDIDAFAVGKGPGSFTGLRIGACVVKGLAHPYNKPVIGVSSLKACAFNQHCGENEYIVPIFDAQRSGVYTSLYTRDKKELITLEADRVVNAGEYFEQLSRLNKNCLFCGDGVLSYGGAIKELLGEKATFAEGNLLMPKASSVAYLAMAQYEKGEYSDYAGFMPEYFRDTDAQTGRKA